MLQSAFDLTHEYQNTFYATENELFRSTKTFIKFYKNFILINEKAATEKQIEDKKLVLKDWEQILRWFRLAINSNNLPHVMDTKESGINVKAWETENSHFEIVFTVPVYATSRNKNNVTDEGMAQATITASGYYNLQEKSSGNSYGMKFTALSLVHPEIDHKKRQ